MSQETTDRQYIDSGLSDLRTEIRQGQIPPVDDREYGFIQEWTPPGCFWDCILQDDLDSAATDWESEFFQDSVGTGTNATERLPFRKATAGGELDLSQPHGSISHNARFAKIKVHADGQETIRCAASFVGASSDVQRKVNGTITAMTGPNDFYFNIELIPGDNFISFALDEQTQGFTFWGRLFDGRANNWVPLDKDSSPEREGYSEGGGTGGGGGGEGGHPGPIPI